MAFMSAAPNGVGGYRARMRISVPPCAKLTSSIN